MKEEKRRKGADRGAAEAMGGEEAMARESVRHSQELPLRFLLLFFFSSTEP